MVADEYNDSDVEASEDEDDSEQNRQERDYSARVASGKDACTRSDASRGIDATSESAVLQLQVRYVLLVHMSICTRLDEIYASTVVPVCIGSCRRPHGGIMSRFCHNRLLPCPMIHTCMLDTSDVTE